MPRIHVVKYPLDGTILEYDAEIDSVGNATVQLPTGLYFYGYDQYYRMHHDAVHAGYDGIAKLIKAQQDEIVRLSRIRYEDAREKFASKFGRETNMPAH